MSGPIIEYIWCPDIKLSEVFLYYHATSIPDIRTQIWPDIKISGYWVSGYHHLTVVYPIDD